MTAISRLSLVGGHLTSYPTFATAEKKDRSLPETVISQLLMLPKKIEEDCEKALRDFQRECQRALPVGVNQKEISSQIQKHFEELPLEMQETINENVREIYLKLSNHLTSQKPNEVSSYSGAFEILRYFDEHEKLFLEIVRDLPEETTSGLVPYLIELKRFEVLLEVFSIQSPQKLLIEGRNDLGRLVATLYEETPPRLLAQQRKELILACLGAQEGLANPIYESKRGQQNIFMMIIQNENDSKCLEAIIRAFPKEGFYGARSLRNMKPTLECLP